VPTGSSLDGAMTDTQGAKPDRVAGEQPDEPDSSAAARLDEPNAFAGARLDRAGRRRRDGDGLRTRLDDPESRAVLATS
jgi:hypothetical protein